MKGQGTLVTTWACPICWQRLDLTWDISDATLNDENRWAVRATLTGTGEALVLVHVETHRGGA